MCGLVYDLVRASVRICARFCAHDSDRLCSIGPMCTTID